MKTLYLTSDWDLTVDIHGNIAAATNPYQIAQDAASAIRTWLGECWYDVSLGLPFERLLGRTASLETIRQHLVQAAMTAPGVVAAQVFFRSVSNRVLTGQVQVTDREGVISTSNF